MPKKPRLSGRSSQLSLPILRVNSIPIEIRLDHRMGNFKAFYVHVFGMFNSADNRACRINDGIAIDVSLSHEAGLSRRVEP